MLLAALAFLFGEAKVKQGEERVIMLDHFIYWGRAWVLD